MTIQISEELYNDNVMANGRKVITSTSAFGILRQQLIKIIGVERTNSFLFQYGWETGVNDAKEALKTGYSLEELIKLGPVLHMKNGHTRGIKHDCSVQFDENGNIASYYSTGIWVDSYEAADHLERIGISQTSVCHTLSGYSSGFMSTVSGEELLAKEITCIGKGGSECRWVLRLKKEWESERQGGQDDSNKVLINNGHEVTYEQLLNQPKLVTRLAEFQKRLTEEIGNGSDLRAIVDMFFSRGRVPIVISDTDYRTIAYSGFSEERYFLLKKDMDQFLEENREKNGIYKMNRKQIFPNRTVTVKTKLQERSITPILVQKEVIGFCSFVYEDTEQHNMMEDYLFLDRFSKAVSIVLLNEKTKFESFERMKGNFLDQILDGKLPASEMMKRGRYTGVDLTKPFYITVMEYKKTTSSIEEEFLLHDKIFETTFRYFHEKKHNLLVGQRDGNMVLFMPVHFDVHIEQVIKEYQRFITDKYPQVEFNFGISNLGEEIENALNCYEEAVVALRLTLNKGIVPFHSLGILGVLINTHNISGIKMIAKQELGPLYHTQNTKTLELLNTLYVFLLNGGKLEQTMNDLSLSLSGLRNRIIKIEGMLEKDLRDPYQTHQLLLCIQSLIALGELNFDYKSQRYNK